MKHAVIVAHPNPHSLTCSVARAYAEAVDQLGHTAIVRDLYAIGFDPCLKAMEIPRPEGYEFAADVLHERALLADADVFALIYPFWFNAPPAILKGYIDRVFSMDFGYAPVVGGTEPLLEEKRLISFSFSGAPDDWVRATGALQALTTLFDQHLSGVSGLRILGHVHTGRIVPNMTEEAFADVIAKVRKVVDTNFGPESDLLFQA